jgi:hypothetical protein
MDFKTLYDPFIDPATGEIKDLSPQEERDFLERVVLVTEAITEVERKKLKAVVARSLNVKPQGKTEYVFLTVNFDPSKAFAECFKAAQKLAKRNIFEWSTWAHEQRGTTPETAGNGHHVHILAKLAHTNAKTRAKTTVCTVCDTKNSAIFNWKYIPAEYVNDKYEYITLGKALEKQAKQVIDKVWRSDNSLLDVYHNACSPEIFKETSPPDGWPKICSPFEVSGNNGPHTT